MSSHTPFLSVLVLAGAAFPSQVFRVGVATFAVRPAPSRAAAVLRQAWLPASFLLVAALAWYVAPAHGGLLAPTWWWYAVAVAAGLAAPAWEVAVGFAVALARRRRPARVVRHAGWGDGGALAVAAAVVVGFAEEVIFRGVGLSLVVDELGAPVVVAVALTALAYGFNHLYFGWLTVAQKCLTGVAFGMLFVASGHSLLVPVVAHVVQNLAVSVGWRAPVRGRAAAAVPVGGRP